MKIKTKLTIGVGLLFLFILLLANLSIYYINALKKDTNNILVSNYNTLEYSRNMLLAIEEMGADGDPVPMQKFEVNLQKQARNVTEIGEKEVTGQIAEHFSKLKKAAADPLIKSAIRKDISDLTRLNMDAIGRKSEIAKDTAETATIWLSVTGAICFIISFTLLVNLPGNIANPIKELTESIKQIAAQNYKQRVHFTGQNEFGALASSFNTMAQQLEEYSESNLARIIKGKKRIETLINNMHDPVIGVDEHQIVLFANSEALKVAGLKSEAFIGSRIQDVAVHNDLIRTLIADIMPPADYKPATEPVKIFADHKESYFQKEIVAINIVPTGEEESAFIGYVIILKNITPFKELDTAKTNFIATVSHEFKTPIASIKMSLQLLENERIGVVNPEQQELLESIKEDTNRLLNITKELLDMSQVETGTIQLNIHPDNAGAILEDAVNATRMQADQKKITIRIEADPDVKTVAMDSEKTAWVLTNFMSNAIRYSHEGGVILLSLQKKNELVYYAVTDFGNGFEGKYRDKVFDRYFQIPGSSKSGTGLGLAISKDFIEAQGGTIGVETELGKGSVFYFYLPGS
ncbi:PAS domain-containing sensor histidine kinase [Taibaiella sp. KBW10]|uniref:HAMP domain-containing sensor histidine kinase n=1 Tax=Taibaiella sp. KBW10 TaxID=2153357 RepID=UPI000F5A4FEB|nr:histidine kinase dimerization/phospho-acceptor domain-containing protein [Taibaiella sp. KBW10]RQO29865.1 PAS domain-containing sensor histidine kinase [Taibaiella sp. KBW10]